MRRRGFSLVELLVVIGIIAVLMGLLFPVFISVRRSARKATCVSNLRQLTAAARMYADDYDRTLVPARAGGSPTSLGYTWCRLLQSYIKDDKVIICPEDGQPQQAAKSDDLPHSYGINYNLTFNTGYALPLVLTMGAINNTSTVLLFFDMKPSAQAMGSSYSTSRLTRVDDRHAGRCGVGFLDGHVKMMLPKETEMPTNQWLPN